MNRRLSPPPLCIGAGRRLPRWIEGRGRKAGPQVSRNYRSARSTSWPCQPLPGQCGERRSRGQRQRRLQPADETEVVVEDGRQDPPKKRAASTSTGITARRCSPSTPRRCCRGDRRIWRVNVDKVAGD